MKNQWWWVAAGWTALATMAGACSGLATVDPASELLVGGPCLPTDEHNPRFRGFRVGEVTLEHEHPSCGGGVCLVNHFQGRVSCPGGQVEPRDCTLGDEICTENEACVEVEEGRLCADSSACRTPGTSDLVTERVCGQCDADSGRAAAAAVHCSCRCGPAAGQPPDPNGDYCVCPEGTICEPLIPDVGLSQDTAGSYCIKPQAKPTDNDTCGPVEGFWGPACAGLPAP